MKLEQLVETKNGKEWSKPELKKFRTKTGDITVTFNVQNGQSSSVMATNGNGTSVSLANISNEGNGSADRAAKLRSRIGYAVANSESVVSALNAGTGLAWVAESAVTESKLSQYEEGDVVEYQPKSGKQKNVRISRTFEDGSYEISGGKVIYHTEIIGKKS